MSDFPVMLARGYDAKRVEDWSNLVVEPKMDGVRVIAKVSASGRVQMFSRNGRVLDMFGNLQTPLFETVQGMAERMGHVMVDGEMLSGTRFEDIGGAIHRKDHTEDDARFHVFFAMPWECFRSGADDASQLYRMQQLERGWKKGHTNIVRVQHTFVTADPMVEAASRSYMDEGFEGVMVKQVLTHYGDRRSYDWMKVKAEDSVDVRVVRLEKGKGKYAATLGKLVVVHKGVEVGVSGMTDAQRDEWWKKPKSIIGKTVEVTYQHVTDKGSLRHPRFKRLRPDKD